MAFGRQGHTLLALLVLRPVLLISDVINRLLYSVVPEGHAHVNMDRWSIRRD